MKFKIAAGAFYLALTLVACGGGGGGGSDSVTTGTPSNGTGTATDPNLPTFDFSALYPPELHTNLSEELIANGSNTLRLAQLAVDTTQRFATESTELKVTANCAYSGTITLTLDDRDGNRRVSAGDGITAQATDCGLPVLEQSATGSFRVEVISADNNMSQSLQVRIGTLGALRLARWKGPNLGGLLEPNLQGKLSVRWTASETNIELRALSLAPDEELQYTFPTDLRESARTLSKIDVARQVRLDTSKYTSSMAFKYDLPTRGQGGFLNVKTSSPFEGDLAMAPTNFKVEAEISGGRTIRAESKGAGTMTSQLVGKNGQLLLTAPSVLTNAAALMRDENILKPYNNYSSKGDSFSVIASDKRTLSMSPIDRACQQGANTAPVPFRADALFRRPVLSQAALSEHGSIVKLLFGRAISKDTPNLQFRFTDAAYQVDPDLPTWHVATQVIRRGSYFEIRPLEPLRKGRGYILQASVDGMTWDKPIEVRDEQNELVHSTGTGFLDVYTELDPVAILEAGSLLASISPSLPARLKASATSWGAPISTLHQVQWEQISGPKVTISAPTSAAIEVAPAEAGSQTVDKAVLQVTVAAANGQSDRMRVVLTVGNTVNTGAVFYTEFGSSAGAWRREMNRGPGSFHYMNQQKTLAPRLLAASEGGTGSLFSITPPLGTRLEPKRYEEVTRSDQPGTALGLISRVFCETEGSNVRSVVDVLEVSYANDGTVTSLALDFFQQCDAGRREYQSGRYRFNSNASLHP